jgi:magnesium chelatase subunit D
VALLVDLAVDDADAGMAPDAAAVAAARARLAGIACDAAALEALCLGAEALGVTSARVLLATLAAARASAALAGRDAVAREDLACAARLVLAPRATVMPEAPVPEDAPAPSPADPAPTDAGAERAREGEPDPLDERERADEGAGALSDLVVEAVRAALPPGMLAAAAARAAARAVGGRAGAPVAAASRGRQVGVRRGDPRGGARLDLVATLRAAAPYQRIRRPPAAQGGATVSLRRDDFRVRRCVAPARTTTIFVVDASGSAALHRLAEAKGAVEMMLAEGYARRECVAVIAFRGTTADVVLAPTHALARARRAIAGLPAGGGTPLAAALDRAAVVAQAVRRGGSQTVVVLLTDGRANVARDGRGGRSRAEEDALAAAATLRTLADGTVLVDTAARSEPFTAKLAAALGARLVPLPASAAHGGATIIAGARAAAPPRGG